MLIMVMVVEKKKIKMIIKRYIISIIHISKSLLTINFFLFIIVEIIFFLLAISN